MNPVRDFLLYVDIALVVVLLDLLNIVAISPVGRSRRAEK